MTYLVIKWLHVLSSTILFGTGIGSAFYMLLTSLGRDARTVARVSKLVVLADWLFTTPTAILQPATGLYLVHLANMEIGSRWLAWSIGLYVLAIACWLPVVFLQIRLAASARVSADTGRPLSTGYWRLLSIWAALGAVAFFAFVAIFWLMVTKVA
ncbi:DUF2269 family protein [Paraburkholderia rhynchosiae]|uniref:DUF2269 domain-containing protein n=1 Tax=Paraburkholderia rhynchosiae TaxID=487049 RepID=A0A2N7WYU9_9BURK|nr:DUF2269 domain-containing protein [Paraburkholderia rhynchosiae]PMS34405.1 DUF2269 domain-containing protein [Paraburkholderia rhynchosiae]CAB3640266.1 hypothetical protein LMG27174_00463 [Paraburkholderia rhynchosiae]